MKRVTIRRGKRRGFTLMELLVVLGILVLLMAIVTPKIIGVLGSSNVKTTKTQIGLFKGALKHYYLDMNTFPTTEQGIRALVERPVEEDEDASLRWNGPYFDSDELPRDPWGHEYQYVYPPEQGNGRYPDIWSYGPDGEDNTADDICNWRKDAEEGEEGLGLEDDRDLDSGRDAQPAREPRRETRPEPRREPAREPRRE